MTRRTALRGLVAGAAGLALPAASGTAAASTASMPDSGQYTSDVLAYTDRKAKDETKDFTGFLGSTPTDIERRTMASVVGHTGPQPIRGVPDEVRYTFVVNTTVATSWVDAAGDFQATSDNISRIENVIEYPTDTVRTSFPEDEDWIGGYRFEETGGDGPIDEITDDSTVVGAAGDLAWGLVLRFTPYLGDVLNAYDFVTDLADVLDGESSETVRFDYDGIDPESGVNVYRKFTVQMDRADTADLTFTTRADLVSKDHTPEDFTHTVTLDPDSFVGDVGGHPFEAEIRGLVDEGAISGYPDGTFRPEQPVSRAEFAVMIDQALDPNPYRLDDSFTDIDGHWAASAIKRVAGADYFGGYPDGTFRPDDPIRKVETIVALASGEGYSGGDTGTVDAAYVDAWKIPDWARQAVANAYSAWDGVENYHPGPSYIDPERNATRAEAAKYVYDASH